jgi:hypothetical protein
MLPRHLKGLSFDIIIVRLPTDRRESLIQFGRPTFKTHRSFRHVNNGALRPSSTFRLVPTKAFSEKIQKLEVLDSLMGCDLGNICANQ